MLKIIDQGDICPLFGVMLILFVPGWMVASDRQKKWGVVIGVIAFLLYGGYALDAFPPKNADAVFSIALKALTAFGLVWGLSLLILPLVYGAFVFVREKVRKARAASEDARRKYEMEEETKRNAIAREKAERLAVPEAEKRKQEKEAKMTQEATDQKRCSDARASVELFYQLNAHLLASRFDKAMFDDWVKREMNGKSPEFTEERGKQLRRLMEDIILQVESAEAVLVPKGERSEARETARRYYAENKEFLSSYPPSLLEAFIRKEMGDTVPPDKCWDACHRIIGELQVHIGREQDKRKREEDAKKRNQEKIKELDKQIQNVHEQIKLQENSPMDAKIGEAEIGSLQKLIAELEEEKEKLK
jgi:hypothetical protein